MEIEDIITISLEMTHYNKLRAKLIERLSSSKEQRVRQLITEEELGDCKPSHQFLQNFLALSVETVIRSFTDATVIKDNLIR